MEKYNIVYIDDDPEAALSQYLDRDFSLTDVELSYSEIRFDPTKGYESLLMDSAVRQANIIFVDSRLFENQNATAGKFTGEEFKFVLKKIFPYIEVVVITQNEVDDGVNTVKKYDSRESTSAKEYYDGFLPDKLKEAFSNITEYRKLSEKLRDNDSWEKLLKEKVIATLEGSEEYDPLTKSDIDSLVAAFNEIREKINAE